METKINWDLAGIFASLACAIHCAILPLVMTSLPVLGVNIIDNTAFELGMILLAAVIGILALVHGYRKHHGNVLPFYLFGAGVLFLIAKQHWHGYQFWLLPFAVVFILAAHICNLRLSRWLRSSVSETADRSR